jgi:peroxiredoxin
VDALLQVVGMLESGHVADRFFFPVVTRAFRLLCADHVQDERVAQACLRSARLAGPAIEPCLQALLAKSRDREIRAYACWALAHRGEMNLLRLERIVATASDRPELRRSLEFVNARQDPEFTRLIETINKADKAVISSETEALLERVISEYGDVPFPASWDKAKRRGKTLADQARLKLDTLRTLAVGKVAPDIQGEDISGKPMRLSDYRGKVVVLVFWGTWCGPCMGLVPHEKALVERLKDRPFALLGINSDADREMLQAAMEKEGITWRSWWDGGKIGGPIAARWDVKLWPTIFVVDENGLIRYKNFPHHAHKELADAVDSLLKEMTP